MKKEDYYVGVYWGARRQSPREVAERLAEALLQLRTCHPLLAPWNRQANTFEEALRRVVEPRGDVLEPFLTTIEPETPTRFGYDLMLWNGREANLEQCTLSVTAGMVQEYPRQQPNHMYICLTDDPDTEPALHAPNTMLEILDILARVWRPDWGLATSHEYSRKHADPDPGNRPPNGTPEVGWMTYLRAERLAGLPERVPCKTMKVGDIGTIFVVTDDHRFTAANPADIAAAYSLRDFLQEHGALETIPTNLPI